ncbi:hypothetical protein E1218_02850 [Kribbella turkmenica]|uniref:TrbL/VirB6 plasmid conjugal transfer protein n=1 Tax=Kribbella turkmenica TaxID=2530375 RepID=A0A4R4XH00_9ACTN|nr:type IV secretion system protein [Kribbella turkmenica]TDD29899.1 hypothetical protein E1218_02850 [Kribbella turkmenica]
MCGKVEIGCHIQQGFQAVANNALEQLREGANQAAMSTLNSASTFWLRPKSPTLAEEHGETWTNSATVGLLQGRLLAVTAAVLVISILIAGMRTAWEQRARPLQEMIKTTLIFVAVSAAGAAFLQVLTSWSDDFAVRIIAQGGTDPSLDTAFGGEVDHRQVVVRLVSDAVPTLLAITMYGSVIIASCIQIVLMLIRSAMLVLLAGTFPLAAAATNTEIGRNWFKKYCAWALAFIAYKPAAALIYAAALQLNSTSLFGPVDSVIQAMTGVMMLLLAIFALPALLRFMVPVTAAVAGGAAAMGSSVADPGGLASGAISVGRSAFGGGSSRGGGSSGGGGAGASGARTVGAAAGVGLGAAGVAVNGARKVAGGLAGAAAHSAGEPGGGSVTPTKSFGPMSRGHASKLRSGSSSSEGGGARQQAAERAGPSGSR